MQKCDEISWEEFFYIYWPLVDNLGQKYGLPRDACKDLMQEVMLDLFKDGLLLRYDSSRGKFRTFLGVLVRHKVSDMLQGASHFSEFSVAEITKEPDSKRIPETTWTKSPEEDDPFQKIFDEEYRNCLLSLALNELRNNVGAKTYAIFEMVVLQHRSPQDVARFLGINRAVIAVYCSRCRKKLRRIAAEIRIENPDFNLGVPL